MAQLRSSELNSTFICDPLRRTSPAAIMRNQRNRYGGVVVKFKVLLDRWKKEAAPARTAKEYAVRLNLDDAARLHALAALFPDRRIEELITDLLHAGLDEVAAAMPYVAGPKIISRDDHGDPSYEDVGLTPRFVELTRRCKKELQAAQAAAPTATPVTNPAKAP
jgi:hypothetical protein